MKTLSASRLNDFLGCSHAAALWLADESGGGGAIGAAQADPSLKLIREKGFEHEAKVLSELEKAHGPAVRIPSNVSQAERLRLTRQAAETGAGLIYQGALLDGRWIGLPDFLIRNGALRPEDAKLARRAKGEHLLQLGIYAELLEAILGIPVGDGVVHVALGEPVSFDLRRTRYILKRLMSSFERFASNEARTTKSAPCSACGQCDYQVRCEAEWRNADSPYFVAGVNGSQISKLAAAGILTLTQLAKLKPGSQIDGMGAETLAKLSAQARLQRQAATTGKHSFELLPTSRGRGFGMLPPPDKGDLFFDMEGDPFIGTGLEYLFGVYGLMKGSVRPVFKPIWAHDSEQEKVAFQQVMRLFIDQVSCHPQAHIYHYAAYEPTALKRMAMRYAVMEAELDQLLRERRFVDLYRVVQQSIRASTESYSIKDLEILYWRKRSGEVTNAADSIVEYERWSVTREQSILDAIASYNQDDCVSTAGLRDWLEKNRPAGMSLEIVDEQSEKEEQSAERAEREGKKIALAAAVRACRHGDARLRDLLAELLWFHQRSQKPAWWALFERQSWPEDELVDDPESLGALRRDPGVAQRRTKQSLDTAYIFPPQDTKLKVGDTPRIAETLGSCGTIVELSADEGRAVLRRSAKFPMPDALSLVPAPISLRGLPEAVFDLATRFKDGASGADQALIDILTRLTPRLKGRRAGKPLRRPGETLVEAVIGAVKALDRSYLFIQGPPGTGKTYTSAQAIIALLRDGKRVGVSSNSHKAINKLLVEVEKQALEAGFSFCGAKKGNKGEPETEFDGANIVTVTDSKEVAPSHELVGGTAFHFCRPDQRQAYDYLFVDEAGQVSLGNLAAMAGAANNIVLIGDQMQLPQPVQGVHPGETGLSSLEYLLEGAATVAEDRGILLNESYRLHPKLCAFISEAVYDGRLTAHPSTADRQLILGRGAGPALKAAGISFVSVPHEACTQASRPEADSIASLVKDLLRQKVLAEGKVRPMALKDILVVAPYNLQVNLLRQVLPDGALVGTVDKFQGQEAAVVIVSMTTSRGTEAPRGTEFLFNNNRFNVALSRAECLAIVVHGTELLEGAWTKIDDLRRLNFFAHAEAVASDNAR